MISKTLSEGIPAGLKTPYTQAIEDMALQGAGDFSYEKGIQLPSLVANGVAYLQLPDLPDDWRWVPPAAAAHQAKVVTCGTAGNTLAALVHNGVTVASWDLAHDDTDATYENATAVNQGELMGGARLELNITGLATGVVGPLTLKGAWTIKRYQNGFWS